MDGHKHSCGCASCMLIRSRGANGCYSSSSYIPYSTSPSSFSSVSASSSSNRNNMTDNSPKLDPFFPTSDAEWTHFLIYNQNRKVIARWPGAIVYPHQYQLDTRGKKKDDITVDLETIAGKINLKEMKPNIGPYYDNLNSLVIDHLFEEVKELKGLVQSLVAENKILKDKITSCEDNFKDVMAMMGEAGMHGVRVNEAKVNEAKVNEKK